MGWFKKKASPAPTPPADKPVLWTVCPSCKEHIFKEVWDSACKVCPKCQFHERLTCHERMALLTDPGTFKEINAKVSTSDPLQFSDAKGRYDEKAREAKATTGLQEAVLTGTAKMGKIPVVLAIMDFRFMGGSLASGTGERILLAASHALKHKQPYIIVSASGGARMHEGTVSLMQMAKTCAGLARLHEARIPYISILTDPTTGGVSASYAMMGDLNIAEPKALIGFAGRRVIEQTIKQKLPDDFQTSEYLLEHGFVDAIVARKDMKDFLVRVLMYRQAR